MVNQLIDELTPSAPDFQVREACDQLVSSISTLHLRIPIILVDQYFKRSAGDAIAACIVAWDACHSRSVRREMLPGRHDETFADPEHGRTIYLSPCKDIEIDGFISSSQRTLGSWKVSVLLEAYQ
jgi:hypothetical protein